MATDTDKDWEELGKLAPYHAVLTYKDFADATLSDEALSKFFSSGETHLSNLLSVIQNRIDPSFTPSSMLDYGCGVGRILIPMARKAQSVCGIDVSHAMLEECQRNLTKHNLSNCDLIHANRLSDLEEVFDFIHSYIVFQHIPPTKGIQLFTSLLDKLSPRGLMALHVPYKTKTFKARIYFDIAPKVPALQNIWNLAKRRKWTHPIMQMHNYDVLELIKIAHSKHIYCKHIIPEIESEESHHGCILFFGH